MGTISPFQALLDLRTLNLRNNSIVNILVDWKYVNLHLEYIDLSFNKITHLGYSDLQFLSAKTIVNLTHNSIMEVNFNELAVFDAFNTTPSSTTEILLNDNPLRCECPSLDFVQFLRQEVGKNVAKKLKIFADKLKCATPERLAGKLVKEVSPKELLCLLDSPNSSIKRCPKECSCMVRLVDKTVIMNCSNVGLTQVPEIPIPTTFGMKSIELFIEDNNITTLPTIKMPGYQHVSEIYARNNSIRTLRPENLPTGLVLLDVSHNYMSSINASFLQQRFNSTYALQNISLGFNPWMCDCNAKDLVLFLQTHFKKIDDFYKIRCASGELLSEMNDLCPADRTFTIVVSILIALLGLFLGAVAALYYKYQQEVKVWLFAHNFCMWFVSEEELDKDKKYDAFISFSHEDEDFVTEHLQPELENGPYPFKLCLHYRDWKVGEFIPHQVSEFSFCFCKYMYITHAQIFFFSITDSHYLIY